MSTFSAKRRYAGKRWPILTATRCSGQHRKETRKQVRDRAWRELRELLERRRIA